MPWDAVHLATAILAGVDVFIARDHKFPEGEHEGVYVTGPFDIDDDKLFHAKPRESTLRGADRSAASCG